MPKTANTQIAVIGIDIGKNSFQVVDLDRRGAIVLRQKADMTLRARDAKCQKRKSHSTL